jgi:uncharacterized protein
MKTGLFLTVYFALASSGLWAASFDCAKARSQVENAICSDPELGRLDEQLAVVYKSALAAHPLPSYVRARQRDWLKLLQDVDSQNFVRKLKEEVSLRINHLNHASQATVYSNTVSLRQA